MYSRFGKYRIDKKLGRGGMGTVYLAFDEEKKRWVALKLVEDGLDQESRNAVAAEETGAELQERLCRHTPHVPAVHEYGKLEDHFYIDMEYVGGKDLADVISERSLSHEGIIKCAIDICKTLEKAHSLPAFIRSRGKETRGIIHGDIKPKNIRIDEQGEVKLLDFGIAKALSMTRNLTRSDFGSLEYCSPERLDSGRLDFHSDLWSVGVLLYEMVSGRKPFVAATPRDLERRIISGVPPSPLPDSCPQGLRAIIGKALEYKVSDRYESASELRKDLASLVKVEGSTRPVRTAGGRGQDAKGKGAGKAPAAPKKGGGPPVSKSRTARLLFLVISILFILIASVPAYNEYRAWSGARRLQDVITSANLTRPSESGGPRPEDEERARDELKRELMGVADRVIADYHNLRPAYTEKDWVEAKNSLEKVVKLDPSDDSARAKKHYCEGHLERIQGVADRLRQSPQAARRFTASINHFTAAAALQEKWGDPHLGLAIVYTYGNLDLRRAADALEAAKRMGLALNERETAIRADGQRMLANKLYDQYKKRAVRNPAELREVGDLFRQALGNYYKIRGFSEDTGKYVLEIEEKLTEIDNLLVPVSGAPEE